MAPSGQQQSTPQIKNGADAPREQRNGTSGIFFLTSLRSACFFNVWAVTDSYSPVSPGPAVCHV